MRLKLLLIILFKFTFLQLGRGTQLSSRSDLNIYSRTATEVSTYPVMGPGVTSNNQGRAESSCGVQRGTSVGDLKRDENNQKPHPYHVIKNIFFFAYTLERHNNAGRIFSRQYLLRVS